MIDGTVLFDGCGDGDVVEDREEASSRTGNTAYSHRRFRVEQTRQRGRDSSHCEREGSVSAARDAPPRTLGRKREGGLGDLVRLTLTLLSLQVTHPFFDFVCLLFCRKVCGGERSVRVPLIISTQLCVSSTFSGCLRFRSRKRSDHRIDCQSVHRMLIYPFQA